MAFNGRATYEFVAPVQLSECRNASGLFAFTFDNVIDHLDGGSEVSRLQFVRGPKHAAFNAGSS